MDAIDIITIKDLYSVTDSEILEIEKLYNRTSLSVCGAAKAFCDKKIKVDLDLCLAIAKIEGECIEHVTNDGIVFVSSNLFDPYNPLTNNDLCFKLMVKYKVRLKYFGDGSIDAWITFRQETYTNANRAICLEIIKHSTSLDG